MPVYEYNNVITGYYYSFDGTSDILEVDQKQKEIFWMFYFYFRLGQVK